jgi:hypothetical protein
MEASAGPARPTMLARAKRLALELQAALADVPIGVVSMTDRTLLHLMPTTDAVLFARTVTQSLAIDQPPPSQGYDGRATNFSALLSLVQSNYYAHHVPRRLAVVFTDGEAQPFSPLPATMQGRLGLILVHVWAPDERIYNRSGGELPDPKYQPDPSSTQTVNQVAAITGGAPMTRSSSGRSLAPPAKPSATRKRTLASMPTRASRSPPGSCLRASYRSDSSSGGATSETRPVAPTPMKQPSEQTRSDARN